MDIRHWLAVAILTTGIALAEPPAIEGARSEIYKTVGDAELRLFIFEPVGHKPTDKSPAIVFFFGGGWTAGSPRQFEPHCRYLAARGMVAITADYRVSSRHKIDKPRDCIKDARSAIRWVRANAARLGIDPDRIAAAGGSAGGHLAACTGMIQGVDESGENATVSCVPNAMVLFNPAVALPDRAARQPRVDLDKALWPAFHVRPGQPPTIMFFGTDDDLLAPAREMDRKMKEAGNRCELVTYPGQKHGFFNFRGQANPAFLDALSRTDKFLASLGWITGEPTIDDFPWPKR